MWWARRKLLDFLSFSFFFFPTLSSRVTQTNEHFVICREKNTEQRRSSCGKKFCYLIFPISGSYRRFDIEYSINRASFRIVCALRAVSSDVRVWCTFAVWYSISSEGEGRGGKGGEWRYAIQNFSPDIYLSGRREITQRYYGIELLAILWWNINWWDVSRVM